ncbi:MAG: Sec-independent protein translocase protein TatB [Sphingomonadales bacterium]|jgi:sec-independent protein translocase protein TatB
MFGIDSSEFLVIAVVALLVIGPKDLPRTLRWLGQWVGKARAMTRHVRAGFDEMMRQAEMEEMQKIWAAQNEAIMKASQVDAGALPDLNAPPAEPPVLMAELPAPEPAVEEAAPEPAPKPKAKRRRKPATPVEPAS